VSTLTSRIKHVRRALDDDGRTQGCIRTVHGRGYRFTAPEPVVPVTNDHGGLPEGGSGGRGRLPAERTPLFGREAAIADVATALRTHRLVSLLGLGGIGKTRVATAVAHHCRERFPDGVAFLDLRSGTTGRPIEAALAEATGLPPTAGASRPRLAHALDSRAALLVLDHAEHAPDELAAVLDELLDHTSGPRFLVASRVPLELPDERRTPVPPLLDAGPHEPSIDFLRAAAARFGLTLGDGDLPALHRIRDDLDGWPLAIELAAAQLRVLSPGALAGRLEGGHVELLRTPRSRQDRHDGLVSVLEDTWALLEASEQHLLDRLAARPAPFAVGDAEALAGDVPPGRVAAAMARWADLSLVVPVAGDARRFRLLEPVRHLAHHLRPGPGRLVRVG
jgi:predicted ATPase